jgi:hypothetical protein
VTDKGGGEHRVMNLKSCVTQTEAMIRYTGVSFIMCQFVLVWTADQTYTGGPDAN